MGDERLKSFQELQVTKEQLFTYAQEASFDENIRGFYVRLEPSPSTSAVGLIEGNYPFSNILSFFSVSEITDLCECVFRVGVRIGRAYSIPHIKYCTKHILVAQPPHPKKNYRITDISDTPFTEVSTRSSSCCFTARSDMACAGDRKTFSNGT